MVGKTRNSDSISLHTFTYTLWMFVFLCFFNPTDYQRELQACPILSSKDCKNPSAALMVRINGSAGRSLTVRYCSWDGAENLWTFQPCSASGSLRKGRWKMMKTWQLENVGCLDVLRLQNKIFCFLFLFTSLVKSSQNMDDWYLTSCLSTTRPMGLGASEEAPNGWY